MQTSKPFQQEKTLVGAFSGHCVIFVRAGVGITAGAHRLWSHRTYKARLPLRLLLVAANSMAGENSIYTWARDHRTHHKFSETDADPHNAKVSPGPVTGVSRY